MDYFKDLRYKLLNLLQYLIIVTFLFAIISDIINKRPFSIIMVSVISEIFVIIITLFQRINQKTKFLGRIIILIFFNIFVIPAIWYHCLGVNSAVPIYSLMIVILSVFFVEKSVEFILPLFGLSYSVFMIKYELINPNFFIPLSDTQTHINNFLFNYLIIAALMIISIIFVNRSYEKDKQYYFNKSITDELTGLYNRRYFFECGNRAFSLYQRYTQNFSVAMFDLDFFKKVNDIYGHAAGDKVLQIFSEILLKETRKSDVCARIGGEEFACIFLNSNTATSIIVANRIRKALEEVSIETQTGTISVTCSIGISEINNSFSSFEKVLKKSDENLYVAKANGRNQVIY